ncbi:MAG: permease [Verrucomicrobiales bacterium]|nr:permease [Verrucomicrobiales bacterium]
MTPEKLGDIAYMFLSLVLEGAPYILLGALVSGVIDAYLPARAMDRLLPRNRLGGVLVAGLLGIVFPVCECAIVPVIRRLVAKGLPVSCAMTYMLTAPIVNPITALSTWSAFQVGSGVQADPSQPWIMTGSRLLMGYIIAVIIGLICSRLSAERILQSGVLASVRRASREKNAPAAAGEAGPRDDGRRLVQALRTAQKDFVDVGMYFTIGILLASFFKTQVVFNPAMQERIYSVAQNHALAPLILMALAFVLSLCSTTDAFVIASDSIFSKAAKLAFLVFGPMMDVKLLFLYSTVFKRRFVLVLVVALALLTWFLCRAWQPVLEPPNLPTPS